MASHSQVLECLRAVHFSLGRARLIMQTNNLTAKVMQSVPEDLQGVTATYVARSALLTEMTALAQSFSQATKAARTLKFYSQCFALEPELRRQRNIFTHKYGLFTAAAKVDWEQVHRTVVVLYPQLDGPLSDAIATLANQLPDPKDEAAASEST